MPDNKRISDCGLRIGKVTRSFSEKGQQILDTENEEYNLCKTCAFRKDSVPNGCVQTQMDILKALKEKDSFYCHDTRRKHEVCDGFFAALLLLTRHPHIHNKIPEANYPYSDPD